MKVTPAVFVLMFFLACGTALNADGPLYFHSGESQDRPVEGKVWETEQLNVDFSKQKITFIELGANSCIPCKAMKPIMKEIAAEYQGKVLVVFYDVWKNPEPARIYKVQLIPTQVFVDSSGKELFRHVGFFAKEEIVKFLNKQGVR